MAKFGGRMTMRLSSGELFSLRGTLNIMPGGQSNEAITNQDGSLSMSATLMPYRFEINFEDRGLDYAVLMRRDGFNVTFAEELSGVTHYFTNAMMTGEPSVNRITGEVTGLTGAAEAYTRTG